jgi:hypothetical protein
MEQNNEKKLKWLNCKICVAKYWCLKLFIVETQLSVNKGFNFYMCAHFDVCDFVSCHNVEHRFSLVAHDKLYTTQNNVW